jgi:hypothetical protein
MTAAPRPIARSRRPAPSTRVARRPIPRRFDAALASSGGKLAPFPQPQGDLALLRPAPRSAPDSRPVNLIASPRPQTPSQGGSLSPRSSVHSLAHPSNLQRSSQTLARPVRRPHPRLTQVQAIPVARKPRWLNKLLRTQRASTVVTTGLVTLSFVLYGWTVYIQHLWRGEFDRMQALERQERQLTAASETLRQHLANQAERPDSGLVLPTPESAIFLPAPSPAPAQPAALAPVAPAPLPAEVPMAY